MIVQAASTITGSARASAAAALVIRGAALAHTAPRPVAAPLVLRIAAGTARAQVSATAGAVINGCIADPVERQFVRPFVDNQFTRPFVNRQFCSASE